MVILNFIIMGLLGGIAYVFLTAKEWSELYSFGAFRRYTLGLIMGYLYNYLHSDWNFPNATTSFAYGLCATFILEAIIEKVKGRSISQTS